jgi:hypothetical protein
MPTELGDLTGKPSPALVTVRAVRITLSNANSLDYFHLYSQLDPRFRQARAAAVTMGNRETYGCKRFHRVKVTDFIEEISESQSEVRICRGNFRSMRCD